MTIADLAIIPEVFKEYMYALIMERSALFRSGLIANVPSEIPSKGKVVNAPFFLGFDGADEVLSDTTPLTVNPVGDFNELAVINFRGKAFGANDLVDALAGADPLGDLASRYADYWVRHLNRVAIATLMGSLQADAALFNDISAVTAPGNLVSANAIIDTRFKLGEYADEVSFLLCHSAVKAHLHKNDLTKDVVVDSVGTTITTYQGMQVIVDDMLAPTTGKYPIILAKPGALVYSDGTPAEQVIETDRDILAGNDTVTSRQRFIMHVSGTSWAGTPTGVSPTNVELATPANWDLADSALRVGARLLIANLV